MQNEVDAAKNAALNWLGLVDTERYEESWRRMSEFAHGKIMASEWVERLAAARGALGHIISRDFSKGTVLDHVDGAPVGKYVVLEFTSKFANGSSYTERVTPSLEADGQFKVAGYYLT